MKLSLSVLIILILLFACEESSKTKESELPVETPVETSSLEGFNPACTTITDDVTIKVYTRDSYNADSVQVKISFENMAAKTYQVCKSMKLNFPLYPVITPAVEIKTVTDSMDYVFDTLNPGEIAVKEFNFSRYCNFKEGSYRVEFLYTTNADRYKDEKLKGLKLSTFLLNIGSSNP